MRKIFFLLLLLMPFVSAESISSSDWIIDCIPDVSLVTFNRFPTICTVTALSVDSSVRLGFCYDGEMSLFRVFRLINGSYVNVGQTKLWSNGSRDFCYQSSTISFVVNDSEFVKIESLPKSSVLNKFDVHVFNVSTTLSILSLDPQFNSSFYEVGTNRSSVYLWRSPILSFTPSVVGWSNVYSTFVLLNASISDLSGFNVNLFSDYVSSQENLSFMNISKSGTVFQKNTGDFSVIFLGGLMNFSSSQSVVYNAGSGDITQTIFYLDGSNSSCVHSTGSSWNVVYCNGSVGKVAEYMTYHTSASGIGYRAVKDVNVFGWFNVSSIPSGNLSSEQINLSVLVGKFQVVASASGNVSFNISFDGNLSHAVHLGNISNSSIIDLSSNPSLSNLSNNDKLIYQIFLWDNLSFVRNLSIIFVQTNESFPQIISLFVDDYSVSTDDSVVFSANISTVAGVDYCIFELFKADIPSPLFNITTDLVSGSVVSKSLSMASLGVGVLSWGKSWCFDVNGKSGSNISVLQNISITFPQSVPPPSGGGGSSSVDVLFVGNRSFKVSSSLNSVSPEILVAPDGSRTLYFYVESLSSLPLDISVSCVGVCGSIVFDRNRFVLQGNSREIVRVDVSVPSDAVFGSEFVFDTVFSDGLNSGKIVTTVKVSRLSSYLINYTDFSLKLFGIPKLLVYIVLSGLFAGLLALFRVDVSINLLVFVAVFGLLGLIV